MTSISRAEIATLTDNLACALSVVDGRAWTTDADRDDWSRYLTDGDVRLFLNGFWSHGARFEVHVSLPGDVTDIVRTRYGLASDLPKGISLALSRDPSSLAKDIHRRMVLPARAAYVAVRERVSAERNRRDNLRAMRDNLIAPLTALDPQFNGRHRWDEDNNHGSFYFFPGRLLAEGAVHSEQDVTLKLSNVPYAAAQRMLALLADSLTV